MARRHASPADFELVGMSSDPTPGDPDLIRGVLQRYSDIGDAAESALNVLRKGGAIESGRGSAMDKLAEMIGDDLPDKLRKTATSYQEAARAYREYIPRLEDAQSTFDQAVDRAQEAAPKANQAPPAALAPDATEDARIAARQTEDAIEAGQAQMSAARSLAEQARSMRETAQSQASEVLDRAAGEAIPERNIFQKIADFFKEFPFVEILLGILIAVVAVFFPVVGFLLGAALFAVTTLPAILAGDFELSDLLLALVSLVPIGGALARGAKIADDVADLGRRGADLFRGFRGGGRGVDDVAGPGIRRGDGSIGDARPSPDPARPVGPVGQGVGDTPIVPGRQGLGDAPVSPGRQGLGEAAGEAAQGAAEEAIGQAVEGEGLSPGAIAGGALAGGLAGAAGGRRGSRGGDDDDAPTPPGTPRSEGGTDPAGSPAPAPSDVTPGDRGPTPAPDTNPAPAPTPAPDRPATPGDVPPRRPTEELEFLDFLPPIFKRVEGSERDFVHEKFPDEPLELRTDDPFEIFTVKSTGENVFFDLDTQLFRKAGGENNDTQPLSDFGQPKVQTFPPNPDHLLVKGFETADLPRIDTLDGLRGLKPGGEPSLVSTDVLQDASVRGDVDRARIDKIKDAFAKGIPLEPVSLSADDLTINDGNHRITAARELGLKFIPIVVHKDLEVGA